MIRVLFGDNTAAISARLQEIEQGYDIVSRIDCRKEKIDSIINAVVSEGLFAEKKLVVLENADKILTKSEAQISQHFKGIESQISDIVLIKSSAPKSPQFAGIKVIAESFLLPKYFFMFLDSIIPGNAEKTLHYYSNIPESVDGEMIFYSIVKRVWQMIGLASSNPAPAFLGVSPWQQARVAQQAKKWDFQKLLKFYKELFQLEKDIKTSNDALPIKHRLDILLATGLN